MPDTCVAKHCSNRRGRKGKLSGKVLSFHRFPLNQPELLKEWVLATGRDKWQPSKTSLLCEEHFKPEDYVYPQNLQIAFLAGKKYLKKDAVPKKLNYPCHLLKNNVSKKQGQQQQPDGKTVSTEDVSSSGIAADHTYAVSLRKEALKK